jgi:hypothetical protein
MHTFYMADLKRSYLGDLSNGSLFVANFPFAPGHQTALVFSEHHILVLTGPEKFTAFKMADSDRTEVIDLSSANELAVRVPAGHTAIDGTSQRGQLIVDAEGAHLIAQWRGENASLVAIRMRSWNHGDVPQGIRIDSWELVRRLPSGQEVAVIDFLS